MKAEENRTHLFYRPRDFILYLFSLLLIGTLGYFAFSQSAWFVLVAGLLWMALTFVLKHGVALDGASFAVIVRGIARYPGQLLARLWHGRQRHLVRIAVFGGVLGIEWFLKQRLGAESFWLRPFPFMSVVLGYFGVLCVFRTAIFVAHLRRPDHIRKILEASEWNRELKGLGMGMHTIQAYVTGLITHATALMPAIIFWKLTGPTYFREIALFVASIVIVAPWGAAKKRLERTATPVSGPALMLNAFILVPTEEADPVLFGDHQRAHNSRFEFTVFHGHHHDSMPTALIGGPGQGFGEAFHETLCSLLYVQGTIFSLTFFTLTFLFDMVAHQYIPGVFPFTQFVVTAQVHHVVHHYGSVKPLGLTGPPYARDVEAGYNPDNRRVRWFVDVARESERLDNALYEKFADLASTGAAKNS